MDKVADNVTALARPVAETLGLDLWDVEYLREGSRWILRVLIDHPGGVSIRHCTDMSRALDPILDDADLIGQSYVLQVSSAGLERSLKRPSDFARFMGTRVEVRLYSPLNERKNGRKQFRGILAGYDGDTVTLENGQSFPMDKVAQVRTAPEI